MLTRQKAAHSKPDISLPAGPRPFHHPKPYWVLVLPACGAYAWLAAWCLLFIRFFLLNFCFCLAHLAPMVPAFHLPYASTLAPQSPPCSTPSTASLPGHDAYPLRGHWPCIGAARDSSSLWDCPRHNWGA